MAQSLQGRIAIVSGSSTGIGAAIAVELASKGVHVTINYPFAGLREEAEKTLSTLATPGIAVEADLSTTTGPSKLVAETVAKYGQVDILINNAALAINVPFEEQTLEDWDRLVNLNGRGTFLLTQQFLKHTTKGYARIVNIASISARSPPPLQTIYAGTKGMVDSFTRCWAKELPPKYQGLTVNAVSPGPTRTEGFAAAGEEAMKVLQPTIDSTPCGKRMGEASEIAYAVGSLCEEKASWICGTHMVVCGGLFVD